MPSDDEVILRYVVPKSYEGLRVDVFLKSRFKRISRTRVRQIIESGNCFFKNRKEMAPSSRVRAHDVICVRREMRDEVEVPAYYKVIHEDGRLLVVDKPAGLPVHPTSRYMKGNLVNLIKRSCSGSVPNLCHRIDRETSGIVLLAKDIEGERYVKKQFAARRVHKSYLALVKGHPNPAGGVIDAALRQSPHSRIHTQMEVAGEYEVINPGKSAVTRYKTVGLSSRYALVECIPETGRQHQIRIHMAHIGCPIVGDKIYSVSERVFLEFVKNGFTERIEQDLIIPRHALHAHTLSILHPDDRRRVTFKSELADDIGEVFKGDGGIDSALQ